MILFVDMIHDILLLPLPLPTAALLFPADDAIADNDYNDSFDSDDFVPFADIDAKKKTIKPILCDRTPVLMQSIGAITRWLNLQHLQVL